ncbi:hypothetical protein CHS0354_003689 [Potamilus streckersoni]|uniref:Lysozyme n=1 Tax=Potamilus streckersoni TaxID=2493646 RepID=A0AAE0SSQ0_9BIVA|nr:hypothetical protein CHS0354_003689 [Potamilus streckersoni]
MLISHLFSPQVNCTSSTTDITITVFTNPSISSLSTNGFSTSTIIARTLEISSSSTSFQTTQSTSKLARRFKKLSNFQTPARLATITDTTPFPTSRCTTKRPVKKPCLTQHKDFWQKLRIEIIVDEGYVKEIYLTRNGVPHFGVSHRITRQDPEFYTPVGTKVSRKRIEEAYQTDIKKAIQSCCSLFKDFQNLPDEVQLIILNMRFNMGHVSLIGFVKFRKAINSRDWENAAHEMEKSKWYKQVTNRAKRLVDRMRTVPKDSDCQ